MAYATVSDLENYLGITIVTPEDIASAELALDIASNTVDSYIGYSLTKVEDDEIKIDGTGNSIVLLPAYPVTEITAIVENGELLDEDEYEFSQFGIVKKINGLWTSKLNSILVTYTHGFEDIPMTIIGVVCSLASRIQSGSTDIKQESIGGYSVTYNSPSPVLHAAELMALDAFRIMK